MGQSSRRPQSEWQQPQQPQPQSLLSAAQLSPQFEDDESILGSEDESALRQLSGSPPNPFASIRLAGGVNSLDNFARSWTRAAAFHEITPARLPFRILDDELIESDSNSRVEDDLETAEGLPLLDGDVSGHGTFQPESYSALSQPGFDSSIETRQQGRDELLFVGPSLSSSLGGSYGTAHGSTRPRRGSALVHPAHIFERESLGSTTALPQGIKMGLQNHADDRSPLLVKQVEDTDSGKYAGVIGQSTLPQTIFNSVNVLIGVGLLSLPLAFRYCGWVIGLTFFVVAVVVTRYTALLLAKCLDLDNSLVTFADLAYVSFGNKARVATSILFTIELIAACVALVVLFGDSLDALVPGYGVLVWKCMCGAILIPLGFLPLRLLSFTSVLGIISCFTITGSVLIAGLLKPDTPGSLLDPARTYLWPEHWGTVLLGFGLLMSPWGGHSVFPNIYRDMRHPYKYKRGVNVTYSFTFCLDLSMGVIGLLMFGDDVRDEVTSNILLTAGYPRIVGVIIVTCIAIIPLTKVPLNARPVLSTMESLLGIHSSEDPIITPHNRESSAAKVKVERQWKRGIVNVLTTILFVAISLVFPSFDRIMGLLGSVCCFAICVILPLLFHLKLFGSELSKTEIVMSWIGIVVSCILAIGSTAVALMPRVSPQRPE